MIKNSFTKPNQFAVEEELQLFILLKKSTGPDVVLNTGFCCVFLYLDRLLKWL